jgi:ComF family protein
LGEGIGLEVRYALQYDPLVAGLITEMKYGDKPGLADWFAPVLRLAVAGVVGEAFTVVPVPMHASKRRERGYNQSELLGAALAGAMGLTCRADVLVKLRKTPSQAALGEAERLGNVAGSIGFNPKASLRSSKILLIDDVVTTGATLRECAHIIRGQGVQEILACAIASSS